MKYINRPIFYLLPVRRRTRLSEWNWGLIGLLLLALAIDVFIIWCAAKAVRG